MSAPPRTVLPRVLVVPPVKSATLFVPLTGWMPATGMSKVRVSFRLNGDGAHRTGPGVAIDLGEFSRGFPTPPNPWTDITVTDRPWTRFGVVHHARRTARRH